MQVTQQRNIGITAHVDVGKTTLIERVLYNSNSFSIQLGAGAVKAPAKVAVIVAANENRDRR